MNHYKDSNGKSWTTQQINRMSDKVAKELLQEQHDEHGHNFCEDCKNNDCVPISVAHIISKKEAKESGRSELCWDKSNMKIMGIPCHAKFDKNNVQWSK